MRNHIELAASRPPTAAVSLAVSHVAREKGVDAATARLLLAGLPDTFDQWKSLPGASQRLLTPSQADGGAP